MIQLGARNYDAALVAAARGGNINIVKQILDLGAKNYDEAIREARGWKHPAIAEFIQNYRDRSSTS